MALIRSKKSSFGESSVTLKNETLTPTQYSSSQIRTGGGSNDPGRVKMHLFKCNIFSNRLRILE